MDCPNQRIDVSGELNEALPYSEVPVSPSFGYAMASNAGCGELRLTDGTYTRFFQQSSLGSSSSLVGLKQMPGSPSPAMMRSGADSCLDMKYFGVGNSYAHSGSSQPTQDWIKHRELVESNPIFNHSGAQSFPVSNMQMDTCNARHPQQVSSWVPEDANNLSSMLLSKPKSSNEGLSPSQFGSQMFQPRQCPLQPFHPPPNSDVSLRAQEYGYSVGQKRLNNEVQGERSSRLPQPFLDQSYRFQQQRFRNAEAPKHADPVRDARDIIFSYIYYKSKPRYACGGQQGFVELMHLKICSVRGCECEKYRILVSHFENCQSTVCQICKPFNLRYKKINSRPVFNSCAVTRSNLVLGEPNGYLSGNLQPRDYNTESLQRTHKRMKMDNTAVHEGWSLGDIVHPHLQRSIGGVMDDKGISMNTNNELSRSKEAPTTDGSIDTADYGGLMSANTCSGKSDDGLVVVVESSECPINSLMPNNESSVSKVVIAKNLPTTNVFDSKELKTSDAFCRSEELNLANEQKEMSRDNNINIKSDSTSSCRSLNSDGISVISEEPPFGEGEKIKLISEVEDGGKDAKCDSSKSTSDYPSGSGLEGLKELGVSAIDSFTAEQIKEHLRSLNQSMNLHAEKALNRNTIDQTVVESTCQLCAGGPLTFTAPPLYCTCCGKRIKHMSTYYSTTDEMSTRSCFCSSCFSKSPRGNISLKGLSFSKAKLRKGKHIEENDEEAWVQCDICERWQHQICGLYNSIKDLEGKEHYTCPLCRLAEMEAKEHVSMSPAFGARDLPRTMLSDHIEQRLFSKLERERKQRALLEGKSPKEVPGAEDLTVRVVLSTNKQLKVKQQFLDILHGETYPTEFPYKSKVILLFQKLEGTDICLFAMYVQEYGSECGHPNKRSVYISYLDSVKHFRPEIRTVSGVALRTFVYHEIMIGYLDYCRRRGYTTCYIWACPPLKGEDYILHCHPETQKRPLPAKLLQWYKNMLKKAVEENVVLECTNLYDKFFVPSEACNSKVTAARLPCFEGDYWSGAIEDTLQTIENQNGGECDRKMTKRTLKLMGHTDLSVDATKDILVMQKLSDKIQPSKENFIVVSLQFTCTKCNEAILSCSRWSCNQCENFHLCSRCITFKCDEQGTHTNSRGEKHQLSRIPINDVAADTDDKDVLLDNEIMENRQSLLSFCEKNHYQFDTRRRAKHSSMMILHHLHKTTALTVRTKSERTTKSMQMQQQRALEVKALLVLEHASRCKATRDNPCSFSNCSHLKNLFSHSGECEIRVIGGCKICKKIWSLLCLHSRNCTDSNCSVPRCMDLRNYKEKLAIQSEVQRRDAVTVVNRG